MDDSVQWVKLNVGGTVFMTTKTTLCRYDNSFLSRLCQDDPSLPSLKDEQGAYLVDRDPRYFGIVLNFLRHGKLILDDGVSLEAVHEEASFYVLDELVRIVKKHQVEKSNGQTVVYRVLQSRETELTHILSTLSNGWRCEHVIPVERPYNAAASDGTEFLIIVSKDTTNCERIDINTTHQKIGKSYS